MPANTGQLNNWANNQMYGENGHRNHIMTIWAASWQNQQNDCAPSKDRSGDDLITSLRLSVRYWICYILQVCILVIEAIKIKFKPNQIGLGIHPVWSESSLCTKWVAKDPSFLHADSEDSDQAGPMSRLIWVFAGRTCHFVGFVMRRLIYNLHESSVARLGFELARLIWITWRAVNCTTCSSFRKCKQVPSLFGFISLNCKNIAPCLICIFPRCKGQFWNSVYSA